MFVPTSAEQGLAAAVISNKSLIYEGGYLIMTQDANLKPWAISSLYSV